MDNRHRGGKRAGRSEGSKTPQALEILFVCVGNAARSQMAEAFARHLGANRVRPWSAGSHPFGRILPETFEVMREKGISLQGQWSKGLEDVPVEQMDVLVTMGCDVICSPILGFKGQRIEWNIPDPFGLELNGFRGIRDLIEKQVDAFLKFFLSPRAAQSSQDYVAPRKTAKEKRKLQ